MKRLIKTIDGQDCEIYAISHHDRIPVGKAVPKVEVYENSIKAPTLGTGDIRYKSTAFSIVVCPDPEQDAALTDEILQGLRAFDLLLWLPRKKDDVLVPFAVYGVSDVDMDPDCWEFRIEDPEVVKKLLYL